MLDPGVILDTHLSPRPPALGIRWVSGMFALDTDNTQGVSYLTFRI